MNSEEQKPAPGNDPEEEMRLENDIMKLKLQAEFGAEFGETSEDVPAQLEQEFLQHVYDFEKAWENQEATTVAKLIDHPAFTPYEKLSEDERDAAWQSVLEKYNRKGISVDFTNEYPLEIKYRFATEELPQHETMFVNMPGMMLGFIYEEFHPNHASDMEEKAKAFLEGWFEKNAEKCLQVDSSEFILENGLILSKEDFSKKLSQLFESFERFEDCDFFIAETSYDKQEMEKGDDTFALGYVEGAVRWKGVLENGEVVPFAGPFKFYLECRDGCWTIMYFVMPGWKW